MSSGERLISRIPGEGLGVIPYNPASSFDAGSASEFLGRNIKEVLAANALTRAAMIAQIVADPTELTDDSAALDAAIRAAIATGQPLRLNGVFYVNTPINIAVDGRRVDLVNHGDMWIIGGPDLDAPVIKIANSATVGGTAARSVAIRVSGFQFDVSKSPYGVLNSVNCLNFSGFRDTIVERCYFYHGEDYREGNAGGDASLFTTSNRIVFKHNNAIGAPDLAVYASGSQTGTQDNISLLSEGNNYIKCANAISVKRNYRYARSVGDHFDGCYNCVTAAPAGGTGDGQLCGSRVVVTGATFRNIIAKCFDPRSSSNWHGSGVISGTFGIDLAGATVANAAFIGIAGSENCSFDIVGEVEGATDSTHTAVRISTHLNSQTGITSISRGNTVRATVKNIYNGLLEFAPCEKNTVELNLSGVANPVTMPNANLTRVTINNDGARSEITGNFDTTPNRAQFTGTIYTASASLSLGAVGRTVQAQPAASAVQLALPTGAASGDNIDVMKIAGSGVGLVQIRNPANTTTIFNIADVGGTVQMRFNGTDWLPVERYVSDRVVTLVQTPAASIANPPAAAKTLFVDSADSLLKTKTSAGAVDTIVFRENGASIIEFSPDGSYPGGSIGLAVKNLSSSVGGSVFSKAVADGVTNSASLIASELLAASIAGKELLLPPGRILISDYLLNAVRNNVFLRGSGKGITTLIVSTPAKEAIRMAGGFEVGKNITSTIPIGSQVIPVSSITGISVGDWVSLKDTSQPVYDNQDVTTLVAYNGEMAKVSAVSTGQITIYGQTEFAYNTGTSTVQKMTGSRNISISDMSITVPNPAMTSAAGFVGININAAQDVRLSNLEFIGFDEDMIRLSSVVNFSIKNCTFTGSRNDLGGTPYCIAIADRSWSGLISNCNADRGRHLVTSLIGSSLLEPAHVSVTDCIGHNFSAAVYDTHPGARHWQFANCLAHSGDVAGATLAGPQGFQIRGRYVDVIDPQVVSFRMGVRAVNGSNVTVTGGRISKCQIGVSVENSPYTRVNNVLIDNPIEKGVNVSRTVIAAMPGVEVENVIVTGNPSGAAFDIAAWEDNYTYVNNIAADATTQVSGVPHQVVYGATKPDAVKFETMDRGRAASGALAVLTSGTLQLSAVRIKRGEIISGIQCVFAAAPVSQTNLWFALYDKSYNLLAVTADALTTAPTTGNPHSAAFLSSFRTEYDGLYYVGICQVAGTVCTMRGSQGTSGLTNATPALCGNSTTSLTTTAPDPASAPLNNNVMPWVALT